MSTGRLGGPDAPREYDLGDMRSKIFAFDPWWKGTAPTPELPTVYGFVMDTSYERGTATLAVIARGPTSVFTNTGPGISGTGSRPGVAEASSRLLLATEAQLALLPVHKEEPPIPAPGRVRITALTFPGRRSAEAPSEDFRSCRAPAAALFVVARGVIDAMRSCRTEQLVTPLMAAAHFGDIAALQLILDDGGDADAQDDRGYTALMYAAQEGHGEAVSLLIGLGANPNAVHQQLSTALMIAAHFGHGDVVRRLLEGGADPAMRNRLGFTALAVAEQRGHQGVVEALRSSGAA